MKIISWDVGIIHLAYCILEYDEETKKFKIYDWQQINLTDYDENEYKCNILIKNKSKCESNCESKCGCNGKFFIQTKQMKNILCGKHKSKYTPEIVEIDELLIRLIKHYQLIEANVIIIMEKKNVLKIQPIIIMINIIVQYMQNIC